MAKSTNYWWLLLIAAVFVVVFGTPFETRVVAQAVRDRGPDGQADRGQNDRGPGDRGPGGRERRRGGGPGGDRQRDREGERNRENGNNVRPPATSAPAAAATANSFGTVPELERYRKQASDIIKLHDTNGNKILEGDELNKLGMSKAADTNHDGTITHNDLVAFYSGSASGSTASKPIAATSNSAATAPQNSGKADDESERLIVNKSRKSYRFKSTKDRTDNWKFSSKDANGDGQVSMSEYSTSWSDRTATEFLRYDKDNDGMITVEEAK